MPGPIISSSYRLIRRGISTSLVYRVFDGSLHGLSSLLKLYPGFWPERHGIEVLRDIAYTSSSRREHTLDIYRPAERSHPLPIILYVHGGSFCSLSKDTHRLLALRYASRGFLVFNINYRLAPQHPFPAALLDCSEAYRYVARHAAQLGGDLSRLVLAGESAGANLITALAIGTSYRSSALEDLFDLKVRPAAVLPFCGLFQVSDAGRLLAQNPSSAWVLGLCEMLATYLVHDDTAEELRALADPLLFLEQNRAPQRPLPPFFVPVGTADPLLDDSRRLEAALAKLGVVCRAHYYEDEIHAFHMLLWRRNAQRCWEDMLTFLDAHLGPLQQGSPFDEKQRESAI
jgi:acetyl esterase